MRKEIIHIEIDQETQSYEMEVNFCKLEHIYSVCQDIISRIDNNEFSTETKEHPNRKIYPSEDDDILH